MSELRRLHVAARYSEAAVFNGVVYLAVGARLRPKVDAAVLYRQYPSREVLGEVWLCRTIPELPESGGLADTFAACVFTLLETLLFVLMVAHQGVRLGRSVHVVDMADRDNRATYTALSNSVIGLVLIAGGIFGIIAQWLGIGAVLAVFTLMATLAIWAAAGLADVQAA